MIGKNNPFNIRFSKKFKWLGQTGCRKGFCNFNTLEFGVRAYVYLMLISYPKAGCKTIRQVIERYAPSSENDTDNYVNYVCTVTSLSDSSIVSKLTTYNFVCFGLAMMQMESIVDNFTYVEIKRLLNVWHCHFSK